MNYRQAYKQFYIYKIGLSASGNPSSAKFCDIDDMRGRLFPIGLFDIIQISLIKTLFPIADGRPRRASQTVLFILGLIDFLEPLLGPVPSRWPDQVKEIIDAHRDYDTREPRKGVNLVGDVRDRRGTATGRDDRVDEPGHVGSDTEEVGDKGSDVASLGVVVPSLCLSRVEVGDSVALSSRTRVSF